jgi:hypothetical protein
MGMRPLRIGVARDRHALKPRIAIHVQKAVELLSGARRQRRAAEREVRAAWPLS